MNEGWIEEAVHYNALGRERIDYKWIGGDVARFSKQLLLDADPSIVRYTEFPRRPGDKFEFGPFKLRVLEQDSGYYDIIVAIRDRGLVTDLRYFWHRFGKMADIAYRRLVITLAVWGLADLDQATVPTWRDVRLLCRMEKRRKGGQVEKLPTFGVRTDLTDYENLEWRINAEDTS